MNSEIIVSCEQGRTGAFRVAWEFFFKVAQKPLFNLILITALMFKKPHIFSV